MFLRIDHVGIACHNLEEKIAFYESTFGLTVVSREVNEAQGVREAMLHVADGEQGASYVQLLQPLSPDTPVGIPGRPGRGRPPHRVRRTGRDQGVGGDRRQGRPADRRASTARVDGRLDRVPASERRRRRLDRTGRESETGALTAFPDPRNVHT